MIFGNMSLRARIIWGSVLPLILLVIVALIAIKGIQDQTDTGHEVQRTYEIVVHANTVDKMRYELGEDFFLPVKNAICKVIMTRRKELTPTLK